MYATSHSTVPPSPARSTLRSVAKKTTSDASRIASPARSRGVTAKRMRPVAYRSVSFPSIATSESGACTLACTSASSVRTSSRVPGSSELVRTTNVLTYGAARACSGAASSAKVKLPIVQRETLAAAGVTTSHGTAAPPPSPPAAATLTRSGLSPSFAKMTVATCLSGLVARTTT